MSDQTSSDFLNIGRKVLIFVAPNTLTPDNNICISDIQSLQRYNNTPEFLFITAATHTLPEMLSDNIEARDNCIAYPLTSGVFEQLQHPTE